MVEQVLHLFDAFAAILAFQLGLVVHHLMTLECVLLAKHLSASLALVTVAMELIDVVEQAVGIGANLAAHVARLLHAHVPMLDVYVGTQDLLVGEALAAVLAEVVESVVLSVGGQAFLSHVYS